MNLPAQVFLKKMFPESPIKAPKMKRIVKGSEMGRKGDCFSQRKVLKGSKMGRKGIVLAKEKG